MAPLTSTRIRGKPREPGRWCEDGGQLAERGLPAGTDVLRDPRHGRGELTEPLVDQGEQGAAPGSSRNVTVSREP